MFYELENESEKTTIRYSFYRIQSCYQYICIKDFNFVVIVVMVYDKILITCVRILNRKR
jgi:hypothetical protein